MWVTIQSKELCEGRITEVSSLGTNRNHADGRLSVICQPIMGTNKSLPFNCQKIKAEDGLLRSAKSRLFKQWP